MAIWKQQNIYKVLHTHTNTHIKQRNLPWKCSYYRNNEQLNKKRILKTQTHDSKYNLLAFIVIPMNNFVLLSMNKTKKQRFSNSLPIWVNRWTTVLCVCVLLLLFCWTIKSLFFRFILLYDDYINSLDFPPSLNISLIFILDFVIFAQFPCVNIVQSTNIQISIYVNTHSNWNVFDI